MKNLELKGWSKLTVQIGVLSISMILLSFFTETQLWLDYFNFSIKGSCGWYAHNHNNNNNYELHYHWNYRAWVYFLTGLTYFIMSVIKIITSHKEEDFKRKTK